MPHRASEQSSLSTGVQEPVQSLQPALATIREVTVPHFARGTDQRPRGGREALREGLSRNVVTLVSSGS